MSDPQATSSRHPFEKLFAQLTGAMSRPGAPVVHELGPVPNEVKGQPGRIVWTQQTAEPVKRGYRRQPAAFCGFLAVVHEVEIYGGSPLEVTNTIAALEGWIDILVGPEQGAPDAGDGYKIGRSKPIETGDGTSTGTGTKIPVTLFLPVYQMIYGQKTVASVSINVVALNPDGTAPTGDPLNPLVSAA